MKEKIMLCIWLCVGTLGLAMDHSAPDSEKKPSLGKQIIENQKKMIQSYMAVYKSHHAYYSPQIQNLLTTMQLCPDAINTTDEDGNTLLHLAAYKSDVKLIEILLFRLNAKDDIENRVGVMPRDLAFDNCLAPEPIENSDQPYVQAYTLLNNPDFFKNSTTPAQKLHADDTKKYKVDKIVIISPLAELENNHPIHTNEES